MYQGTIHKYRPDFIIKLSNGSHLIVEVKGQDSEQDKTKRDYLDEWIKAVNQYRSLGKWNWDIVTNPGGMEEVILKNL